MLILGGVGYGAGSNPLAGLELLTLVFFDGAKPLELRGGKGSNNLG
jgi:hypothetical protein